MGRARRLLTGGALVALGAIALFAPFASGCQGHQCDGDFVQFTGGTNTDRDTYETSSLLSPTTDPGKLPPCTDALERPSCWLPFPHQRVWDITPGPLQQRVLTEAIPYISPVAEPNRPGGYDNFTIGSGNLAELHIVDFPDDAGAPHRHLFVHNDTCADYYLRLVVHAAPETDAGAPADATDASPPIEDDAGDAGDGAPE